MKGLFFIACSLLCLASTAQESQSPLFDRSCTQQADATAQRECSDALLLEFINHNILFPEAAKAQGIEGTVVVQFTVSAEGKTTQVKLLRDIGGDCGKEVLRVVSLFPDWAPAMAYDEPVEQTLTLPVSFNLKSFEDRFGEKLYRLDWSGQYASQMSKQVALTKVDDPVKVRDLMGQETAPKSISFTYLHKGLSVYREKAADVPGKSIKRFIKSLKPGGTLIIIATFVNEKGIEEEVEKQFLLAE